MEGSSIKFNKNNIALFIALLFHVCGLIGILFTPYKAWFISNTPLNLLLMFLLIVFVQDNRNISFFLFLIIAFATGILTEVIGTNTGYLFGGYSYGKLLGAKLLNVPLLIGINWFVIVYCAGVVMSYVNEWVAEKYKNAGINLSSTFAAVSFIMDGAFLATLFDWIMEPVAVKLGLWQWQGDIPVYNYLCWYLVSALLLLAFRILKFNKRNLFAVHLFIIQVLFFIALRTFL